MADPQGTVLSPLLVADLRKKMAEAEFVMDFVDKSLQLRDKFSAVWDEILDNYLVAPIGTPMSRAFPRIGDPAVASFPFITPRGVQANSGVSRLKDPETHQIIETLTAQALGLLLGGREYITARPLGKDDPEKARMLARLLMAILEQPGIFRTFYQSFKNAFLFGTSILEFGWEARSRNQLVEVPKFDLLGRLAARDLIPEEVLYRNRPLIKEVDIYDFYPDPSGTRIQEDMVGVVKRFRITKAEAMRLGEAGVYDLDDVRLAIAASSSRTGGKRGERGGTRKFDFLPDDLPDAYGVLTGFEFWGESPVTTADHVSNRVITLLNGLRVRSRINGFIDGNIPFKEVTINPISGRFYGLSPAEVIRFLQDSADNLLMVFNDAADFAIRGPLLVGQAFNGNPQQLRERKLNDIIECVNPDAVKPIPTDFNPLQFAAQEMLRRKITMREATGATDAVQTIESKGDKTATEINETLRLSSTKIEAQVQLVERDDFPWIGRKIHSLLRQFSPEGGAIATLGGEFFQVPFETIDVDADIRFVGARQATSRFQQGLGVREALRIMQENPQGILMFGDLYVRLFRDALDMADAEDVVARAQKAVAQVFLATQLGANPTPDPNQAPPKAPAKKGPQNQADVNGANESGAAERQGGPQPK